MGRLGSKKSNKKKLGIVDTIAFALISGEEREILSQNSAFMSSFSSQRISSLHLLFSFIS